MEPITSLQHIRLKSSSGMRGNSNYNNSGAVVTSSWSFDGRFLVKANGRKVIFVDSKRNFVEVAIIIRSSVVKCVRFRPASPPLIGRGRGLVEACGGYFAEEDRRLALIDAKGYLHFLRLRISVGNVVVEDEGSLYVEENLLALAWSTGTSLS